MSDIGADANPTPPADVMSTAGAATSKPRVSVRTTLGAPPEVSLTDARRSVTDREAIAA